MSIQRAEQLKREWTDKHVMVQGGVPELRRFNGLVGQVKTVNMNCRLLIEFDTPADISWYDIDPQFLNVVDRVAMETAAAKTKTAASEAAPAAKIATQPAAGSAAQAAKSGSSPLDKIRQQAAGGGGTSAKSGSPLDQIRAQAGGSAAATDSIGSGSPLDQIRAQGGAGNSAGNSAESAAAAKSASASTGDGGAAAASASDTGGSPLDRIRAQAARGKTGLKPNSASPAMPKSKSKSSAIGSETSEKSAAAEAVDNHSKASIPPGLLTSPATTHDNAQISDDSKLAPTASSVSTVSSAKKSPGGSRSGTTPFDQVRRQAASSDGGGEVSAGSEVIPIFDQVWQQAESDEAENAVVTDTHSKDLSHTPISPLLTSSTRRSQALFDGSPGDNPNRPNEQTQTDKEKSPAAGGVLDSDKDVVGMENPVNEKFHGKKLPKKDDLKIIEGIGPKISQLLVDGGIQTWAQLGVSDPARLKKLLEAAGPKFRMHNPETWPAQAKLADDGAWQKLEEYQDDLDGGRPPEQS